MHSIAKMNKHTKKRVHKLMHTLDGERLQAKLNW